MVPTLIGQSLTYCKQRDQMQNFQNCLTLVCSLRLLCGCLKTAFEKSTLTLGKKMKAMWKFLEDSPARRDVYLRCGDCAQKFHQMFYATRWVKNAEVAISVWDNVVAVVKYYMNLLPSKRPQNNDSYETLTVSVNDSLMKIKFVFFKGYSIASLVNIFLITFPTDKPIIPFLSDTLFKL